MPIHRRSNWLAQPVLTTIIAVFVLASSDRHARSQESATDATIWQTPANGGVRRWQVMSENTPIRKSSSSRATVVQFAKQDAILANLGCQPAKAGRWCQVRPFRGGVRGYVLATHLAPAHGPDGVVAMGEDDSRGRARQRSFDAETNVGCAQEQNQALGQCGATVARSDGGDATVVVTFPNGFARSLYFIHGEFVRASATMSGVGTDTDWQLRQDKYLLRVDDQRYEIPRAFIYVHQRQGSAHTTGRWRARSGKVEACCRPVPLAMA